MASAECRLPDCTRIVRRPCTFHRAFPTQTRSLSDRRDARVVAPLVHDEESIWRQRGEPSGFPASSQSGFSTNTGTSASSTFVEDSRVGLDRGHYNDRVDIPTARRSRL